MNSLNDIIKEEDYMIKQLDLMESEMDRYLEYDIEGISRSKPDDQIYSNAKEISSIIDVVQKDLDEISIRLMPENKKHDNLSNSIVYEDKKLGEKINVDVIYIKID